MRAEPVRGLLPVHELIALPPHSPESWICGIASLRGRDFPVIDLRGMFGIVRGSHGARSVDHRGGGGIGDWDTRGCWGLSPTAFPT